MTDIEMLESRGWDRVDGYHWCKVLRTLRATCEAHADLYDNSSDWCLIVTDDRGGILYSNSMPTLSSVLEDADNHIGLPGCAIHMWARGYR